MMNYKIVEHDGKYSVVELRHVVLEEKIIDTFTDREDARTAVRFLNLGGGFDGWTPDFMMTPFNVVEAIAE